VGENGSCLAYAHHLRFVVVAGVVFFPASLAAVVRCRRDSAEGRGNGRQAALCDENYLNRGGGVMLRASTSLTISHGWSLIVITGVAGLAVGLALLMLFDVNLLTLVRSQFASAADSMVVALLLMSAAGALVIHRLRRQNQLLIKAVENMPQGLCMMDSAARLIICNERYLELYGLKSGQLRPGCSMRDMLEHCRAAGTFFGNPDRYVADYLARIAEGKWISTANEMKDGRIIARATRPMPDGGWVDTHEDITERRRAALQKSSVQAHEQRRLMVENAIMSFRQNAESLLKSVADSAGEMRATAEILLGSSEKTTQHAEGAVHSSNEASSNVESVAAAAVEMSKSIAEISRQLVRTSDMVRIAVTEAQGTNEGISGLAQAAQKIGDIVKLIRAIAEQTNLLALNATIEAARAGDAGKGFAVVASEVKSLAVQTAKATEDISSQIAAVQESTTGAVEAIRRIAGRMQEINEFTSAVAASVQEQDAATGEISENVASAAGGTKAVVSVLAEVATAATQTRSSAQSLLEASDAVATATANLRREVERFLAKVAA
jgi:methyl-accepting chemotaxis protein